MDDLSTTEGEAATVWPACPGCGVVLPGAAGSAGPRRNASAACWQLYGEVIGHELEHLAELGRYHQLTVDTYGAQHAGVSTPAIGTAFSLIGLHLALDEGWDGNAVREAHQQLAERHAAWPRFVAPTDPWALTVFDAAMAASVEEHAVFVRRWAAAAWSGWRAVHGEVAALVHERLPAAAREVLRRSGTMEAS